MQDIHSIVTIMLGPPPNPEEKFSWDFYDADGRYKKVSFTPKRSLRGRFLRSRCSGLWGHVAQFFSLAKDPRNEYERLLTVDKPGNVVGGRPITFVNVSIDVRIQRVCKKCVVSNGMLLTCYSFGYDFYYRFENTLRSTCSETGTRSSLAVTS